MRNPKLSVSKYVKLRFENENRSSELNKSKQLERLKRAIYQHLR